MQGTCHGIEQTQMTSRGTAASRGAGDCTASGRGSAFGVCHAFNQGWNPSNQIGSFAVHPHVSGTFRHVTLDVLTTLL